MKMTNAAGASSSHLQVARSRCCVSLMATSGISAAACSALGRRRTAALCCGRYRFPQATGKPARLASTAMRRNAANSPEQRIPPPARHQGSPECRWRRPARCALVIKPAIGSARHLQGAFPSAPAPLGQIRSGVGLVSRVPSVRRCVTVREMKEGPSRSAVRCRPQTAASCCRQKRW